MDSFGWPRDRRIDRVLRGHRLPDGPGPVRLRDRRRSGDNVRQPLARTVRRRGAADAHRRRFERDPLDGFRDAAGRALPRRRFGRAARRVAVTCRSRPHTRRPAGRGGRDPELDARIPRDARYGPDPTPSARGRRRSLPGDAARRTERSGPRRLRPVLGRCLAGGHGVAARRARVHAGERRHGSAPSARGIPSGAPRRRRPLPEGAAFPWRKCRMQAGPTRANLPQGAGREQPVLYGARPNGE
jgi:hypothetical protein